MTTKELYYTTVLFDLQMARYTLTHNGPMRYSRTARTMVKLLQDYYSDTLDLFMDAETYPETYKQLDRYMQDIVDWLIEIGMWEPYNR